MNPVKKDVSWNKNVGDAIHREASRCGTTAYLLSQKTGISKDRLQEIRSGVSLPTSGELTAIRRVLPGVPGPTAKLHIVSSPSDADSRAAEELFREWAASLLRKSRKDFLSNIPAELHPAVIALSETFARKILGKKEEVHYRVFESTKKRLRHVVVRTAVLENAKVHFEYVGQAGYGRDGADGLGFLNKPVLRSTFLDHYREVDPRTRDTVLSEARTLGAI